MKKKIIILVGVVLVIMLGVLGYLYINKNKDTDGKKFAEEYGSVTEDNVFVYRSIDGQQSFKNVSREYLLKHNG